MSLYFHEKSLFLDATKTDKNGFFSFFFFLNACLESQYYIGRLLEKISVSQRILIFEYEGLWQSRWCFTKTQTVKLHSIFFRIVFFST